LGKQFKKIIKEKYKKVLCKVFGHDIIVYKLKDYRIDEESGMVYGYYIPEQQTHCARCGIENKKYRNGLRLVKDQDEQ
jgi:hypothetical protein